MFYLRWYLITFLGISWLLIGCGASKKTAEAIKEESSKSVVLISHSKGFGTGFFIDGETGFCTVITAKHVVPKGSDISIQSVISKQPWKPLSIQRSNNVDLAVITFKPLDGNCPSSLKMGDSNSLRLNQTIYISSYPGGVNGQPIKQFFHITNVSDKTTEKDGYEIGYKTDLAPGTSGSPVLNDYGEIIAIHGRKIEGAHLAIPINLYKKDSVAKPETLKQINRPGLIAQTNTSNSGQGWLPLCVIILAICLPLYFYRYITIVVILILSVFIIVIAIASNNNLKFRSQTIAEYDKLIQQNPNYSDAYFYRAQAKSNSGQKESAINDYDKVIMLDPKHYEAYMKRAYIKLDLGNQNEAIADYYKAIKIAPSGQDRWGFYIKKAEIDTNSGKKEEAINDYDKIIEFLPWPHYYRDRAKLKIDLGRQKEALSDYDKAIELDSEYPYAYRDRAIIKFALGDKLGGKKDYQKAAELFLKKGDQKSYQDAINKSQELGVEP